MPRVNDVLTTEVVTVNGGNLIRVYINDELMGSAFDNTPGDEDGTTGLTGFRNTVRGDNFTTGVLQVDGTPVPVPAADVSGQLPVAWIAGTGQSLFQYPTDDAPRCRDPRGRRRARDQPGKAPRGHHVDRRIGTECRCGRSISVQAHTRVR